MYLSVFSTAVNSVLTVSTSPDQVPDWSTTLVFLLVTGNRSGRAADLARWIVSDPPDFSVGAIFQPCRPGYT